MAESAEFNSEKSMRPTTFRVVLYEAIRRAAEAQRQALQSDDLSSFYNLLMEREKFLDKIDDISKMPRIATNPDLALVDDAHSSTVIHDILSIDRQTEQMLTAKMSATKQLLTGVQNGRKALRGYEYLAPAAAPQLFIDRLS